MRILYKAFCDYLWVVMRTSQPVLNKLGCIPLEFAWRLCTENDGSRYNVGGSTASGEASSNSNIAVVSDEATMIIGSRVPSL